MIRQVVRLSLESLLGGARADRRINRVRQGELLVLAFHNVISDDAPDLGDTSLHIRNSVFVSLIDRLLEFCTPVPLAGSPEPSGPPQLAVTFDDAYRGAICRALPELARRDVPATVFVPTGLVGGREFWWDSFAAGPDGLDPRLRDYALKQLQGDDARIRAWTAENRILSRSLPEDWRSATMDELRAARHIKGVEFAPHSQTHRALDRLGDEDLAEELAAPCAWFERAGLPYRRLLAYPYGRQSGRVQEAARAHGYEAAWLVSGGWTSRAEVPRFTLPRLNIPSRITPAGLMLRVAGYLSS